MLNKLNLSILLVLVAGFAFAQQNKIPFEKYGVAEGLPEEVAISPIQDDKGFIWFGTQNGLVKYNGYGFEVFKAASDKTDLTRLQMRSLWGGLLKAKDGKIWLAGESRGIASFDPVSEQFQNFYPEDSAPIVSNRIMSSLLFEDADGNIWFGRGINFDTAATIFRLNPQTGTIKEFPLAGRNTLKRHLKRYGIVESSGAVWLIDDQFNLQRLNRQKDSFEIIIPAGKYAGLSANVDTLMQLSKGGTERLLLTGTHGLYIFDHKAGKIVKSYVHQPGNDTAIADSVLYAVEDLSGQIWVLHRQGRISLIDPVTDNIVSYSYGNTPLPYQKGIPEIQSFLFLGQNTEGIWFQAYNGLQTIPFFIHYQFANKTFNAYDYNFNLRGNPLPKENPYPYEFLQDHTGLVWLGTRPGLYKQSPKKQQMDFFRFREDEPGSLPSDSIRYLFEDSKKRLWVGTTNGLALYQPDQENFKVFRSSLSNPASLSNNVITTVQEDANGGIWVGTRNGLNLWQESTGNFRRLFYTSTEVNVISFLFSDAQQRLWLSIRDKGVYVLDKNTGKILKSFVPDTKNSASLSSKRIDVFYQDSRGIIWLSDRTDNEYGLYRLNENEDSFTHYVPVPGDSSSISSNEISFLAEDGKQRLWIGTDAGLNLYHYDTDKFTVFKSAKLSSTNFFTTDKNGAPWFGTYSSGGLVSVDVEKGIIASFDESMGLLQNDLTGGQNGRMVKDEFGRFWLPTQRGLTVFDPENKSFISYFEKDGFQSYDRRYTAIKTSNGDIWIGSNKGLNHIVPSNLLKKDTIPSSIVMTQVSINDSVYSKPDGTIFKQSVAYTTAIELKHWQKDLSFNFVALHYLRPEDNLYSWMLENYDKGWSVPSRERKASYTNLSPGHYIFRVKASNADGIWNEEGISIAITILPPWWRTWWAYILYVLLFLGGLRIFSKWREQNLVTKNELLERKVEERTTSLKTTLDNLKSTQAQLIQSEKMASLGELTAGIAHEIQNPLNFINNFADINAELIDELKEELNQNRIDDAQSIAGTIRENEEKIIFHGKRADAIVKGMLQHSRASSGVKEPTDINALADEYLRLAYHGLRAKDKSFNATIKTDFDESIGKINVIPQDIGRVLLNLITNAFHAVSTPLPPIDLAPISPKGDLPFEPTVTVTTRLLKPPLVLSGAEVLGGLGIQISITDNGPGIPEAIKDKIFQPFFTTKPTGQGTGLGLSLSYDIVKAHGGELKVETKEGEGTVFLVQLPMA